MTRQNGGSLRRLLEVDREGGARVDAVDLDGDVVGSGRLPRGNREDEKARERIPGRAGDERDGSAVEDDSVLRRDDGEALAANGCELARVNDGERSVDVAHF